MTAETIEGTVIDVTPPEIRAVSVVQQPGQVIVTDNSDPEAMLSRASKIATALARMVEAQNLYTVIQRKKYPHVEAWMTIGRMDNVVAREARPPAKNDDGSWEAFAELLRLSDGMVIGSSSAMCGGPKDGEWTNRGDHMKRSMAQTRATSRVFRQQYSWIMALAGYEPTPAEEMPTDTSGRSSSPAPASPAAEPPSSGGTLWRGPVSKGQPPVDGNLRPTPDGSAFGFVLVDQNGKRVQVLALGPLADALAIACADGLPKEAEVDGDLVMVDWEKDGKRMPPYRRVMASRIGTPDWLLPADSVAPAPPRTQQEIDAELDQLDF